MPWNYNYGYKQTKSNLQMFLQMLKRERNLPNKIPSTALAKFHYILTKGQQTFL